MSIEKVERTRKPAAWRVRWRDESGRKHSRSFDRKSDAEVFEAKVKLSKRRGDLDDLDAGKQRLEAFVDEWWRLYAEPRLSPKTLKLYAGLRDRYLLPRLGSFELRRLRAPDVQRFQADLVSEGVGQETIRKTLALLQGMLERAVEWGRIQVNPVRVIRKPPQGRQGTVRPLPPAIVEAMRAKLVARDAMLVSILAYAGLRPGEALALTWGDVRENTLIVDKALAQGQLKETKTRQSRAVHLLKPLAADLLEWRMASGRPDHDEPVFSLRRGGFWTEWAYRNWRRRVFNPAAKSVGVTNPRPYDLRHSLASLLFAEGMNPAEIAQQMGHSLQTLLGTYTHVIEELRGQERRTAEALILEARGNRGPRKAPTPADRVATGLPAAP